MPQSLSDRTFQIGYVVPDLQAALGFFKEKLGVPKFLVLEDVKLQDQTYLGRPADLHQSIAFGWAGPIQIELIQPLSGTSTYSEYLRRVPGGGIQHVALLVEDYDQGCAEMKQQGFNLVQSGRNGETRFGYFDTERAIGTLTEIVFIAPAERERFEKMRRGEG